MGPTDRLMEHSPYRIWICRVSVSGDDITGQNIPCCDILLVRFGATIMPALTVLHLVQAIPGWQLPLGLFLSPTEDRIDVQK